MQLCNEDLIKNCYYRLVRDNNSNLCFEGISENNKLKVQTPIPVLFEDNGSYWTTRKTGRKIIGSKETGVICENSELLCRHVTNGSFDFTENDWEGPEVLSWEREIRLWNGTNRVDFIFNIDSACRVVARHNNGKGYRFTRFRKLYYP